MITYEQALTANDFHENGCTITIGPRGGITTDCDNWYRNGQTQTWVTRSTHFRIPVRFGLYDYDNIIHDRAANFHTPDDCRPKIVDKRSIAKQHICPYCAAHFNHKNVIDDSSPVGSPHHNKLLYTIDELMLMNITACHEHIATKHHPY